MKVLLVDDEKSIAVTLSDALSAAGHTVTVARDGQKAIELLRADRPDCVITDLRMPKVDGMEVFREAKRIDPRIRVIVITAYANIEQCVTAMKEGVEDYLQKPFFNEDVVLRLQRLEKVLKLEEENRSLREQLSGGFGTLKGQSSRMREVYELIQAVAPSDSSVLIQGESGTGKERVAESIHLHSSRREGPLVKMSCSVFPEGLIESELFGHMKGAFTDARADKPGRFERAGGGSIFIDDVDDLAPSVQVKLLRVLQEREIERLGGTQTVRVDVRVIAATKKDLWTLIPQGKFREDLFYRLNVLKIVLPPLRDREEDIPLLLQHFITKFGRGQDYQVSREVMEALRSYSWPGNVRELEHAVERAVALAGTDRTLKREHLLKPLPVAGSDVTLSGSLATLKEVVAEAEVRQLKRVLEYTGGHKGEAARILGITRKNLWEKLRDYKIEAEGE